VIFFCWCTHHQKVARACRQRGSSLLLASFGGQHFITSSTQIWISLANYSSESLCWLYRLSKSKLLAWLQIEDPCWQSSSWLSNSINSFTSSFYCPRVSNSPWFSFEVHYYHARQWSPRLCLIPIHWDTGTTFSCVPENASCPNSTMNCDSCWGQMLSGFSQSFSFVLLCPAFWKGSSCLRSKDIVDIEGCCTDGKMSNYFKEWHTLHVTRFRIIE